MDVDDHRRFHARRHALGAIDERRHGQPVERGEADKLGLGQLCCVKVAKFGLGPTDKLARVHIPAPDIACGNRGGEAEADLGAIGREFQPREHAARQFGLRQRAARHQILHHQPRIAVLVDRIGEHPAIGAHVILLDLPFQPRRQHALGTAFGVDLDQTAQIAVAVGNRKDSATRAVLHRVIARGRCLGRNPRHLARCQIQLEDLAFTVGQAAHEQHPALVRRNRGGLDRAGRLMHHARRPRIARIGGEQRIAAGALGRARPDHQTAVL